MLDYSLYQRNVTEFPARHVRAIHTPKDIPELKRVVLEANAERKPLYTISTGHNWGLGSKLPVVDSDIVDLRYLNEIVQVNEDLCYARIQPGVTQKQLHQYLELHAPHLMLNVTGSDSGSSILANALERGSGKNGHRAEDIRELKVMLADGREMSTGYGNLQRECFYKYGLGPDFTHLFTQSNYGIVTEGVVNLMLKQPFSLYLIKFSIDQMGAFLETYARLMRKGVMGHSLELDSSNDPKIYELFENSEIDKNTWIGWFVVYDELEIRKPKNILIRKALSSYLSDIVIYDSEDNHQDSPLPVQVRMDRYHGKPNDHSLTASAKAFGVNIEGEDGELDIDLYREMPGFRCVLPVLPFSKAAAQSIESIIDFSQKMQMNPSVSIIALNDYCLEVFARVYFNRSNQQEINKASEWVRELLAELKKDKVFPYRLDIENMESYLADLGDESMYIKRQLKNLFDPNNILSPKRYIV